MSSLNKLVIYVLTQKFHSINCAPEAESEKLLERLNDDLVKQKQKDKPIPMHILTLCDWFVLPLLLPTLTIWFSLDHKRDLRGIGKLFAFNYGSDSDSVASEKQP